MPAWRQEYVEREDEFDINPRAAEGSTPAHHAEGEDDEVDITTLEEVSGLVPTIV